jgi:hypothetical protein
MKVSLISYDIYLFFPIYVLRLGQLKALFPMRNEHPYQGQMVSMTKVTCDSYILTKFFERKNE